MGCQSSLKTHKDISKVLSKDLASQKAANYSYLQKVLQSIMFLSQQGLPLRGNWVPSADNDGSCKFDSNFHQFMLLHGKDDPNIKHYEMKDLPVNGSSHSRCINEDGSM